MYEGEYFLMDNFFVKTIYMDEIKMKKIVNKLNRNDTKNYAK